MRVPIVTALILMIFQVVADMRLLSIARRRFPSKPFVAKLMLGQGAFFFVYIIVFLLLPKREESNTLLQVQMWMLFAYLTVYCGKFIYILFDLVAEIPTLWKHGRLKWISTFGAIFGAVVFAAMWWGALINRNRTQLREQEIAVNNLPGSFDGYRIVQISDIHTGTFGNDTAFVGRLVDQVNALQPNLIVFTGDIVNRQTSELLPFIKPLSRLSAPDGVISILGNHDYGDYYNWEDSGAKEQNMEWLLDLQIEMGWELLTNSSLTIFGQSPTDSIVIVGVENWGDPPFPRYGNLSEAYPTPADSATKILLTHNPVHWVEEIAPMDTMNFALTLSGHTHAMQVEIAGISPAALRYPTWGGLYQSPDSLRLLYVNIGAGTVGIPMRLGATPEITLFTLKSK